MKKYFQSFRLFFGSCPMKSLAVFLGIMAGFIVVFAIPMAFGGEDFVSELIRVMFSTLSTMTPLCGFIFLNSLYTIVSPNTLGYKHFASVPDIAGHFRRAVVFSNVFCILIDAVLLALNAVVYALLGSDSGMIILGVIMLFVISAMGNFTGYLKSVSARMITMIVTLSMFGFISGFSAEADNIGDSLSGLISGNMTLAAIIIFLAVAAYAASLIYTLKVCGRKWGRDK